MCTLTWRREAKETFEVFFNRDEKKTRSVADPPREFDGADGVRYLSPIDPDAGGTWMLANSLGMVVCLLNRWHESHLEVATPVASRGHLVSGMAAMENVPAVEEALRSLDLEHMRPFTLVAFDQVGERGWDWNGRELRKSDLRMPLTSSSFHYEEVAQARRDWFEQSVGGAVTSGALSRFHSETPRGASAYTVRMCRPDAQTMSRSRVRVDGEKVEWSYLEEPGDLAGEPRVVRVEMER